MIIKVKVALCVDYTCYISCTSVCIIFYCQSLWNICDQFEFAVTAPTGSPSNFVVDSTTPNSASLSWNPPPADQQNGLIRYYVIRCTPAGSGPMINTTSNSTEITLQNLLPFYQYSCTVAAFTITIGPASIVLTFTLPEAGE